MSGSEDDLQALLAERDAEIAALKQRIADAGPKTWAEARSRATHVELIARKLREEGKL